MWDGGRWIDVTVPVSGGENVMVPVIRAIVHPPGEPTTVLLQRRDIPKESVRGRWEIPGGRWRAGEPPAEAIRREVEEETGLTVALVRGIDDHVVGAGRRIASVRPVVVVAGVEGAFPAVHLVVLAEATGTPRPEDGETADVGWWALDEVTRAIDEDPEAFIPSAAVALRAYAELLGGAP
jgi:8-oxo-dGTP diphosphatase